MDYFFLALCLYVIWKYVFHNPEQFPNATTIQKIIHSVTLMCLACACWGWGFTLIWILLHPHQWVEYLTHKAKPYPVGFDEAFQLLGSIVGPIGVLFCYFTLRGYDKARRVLLVLLPLIYLVELYAEFLQFTQAHNIPPLPVLLFGALLLSTPFWFILIFYRHPKVIKSLFCSHGQDVQM
ncbi:MAG TPA: hypothetical protein VMJ12_12105 [Candidatus Acidoferrales bacterium]|nr:hypothetical protein [Candidatus Acidoferrales bacterium]